MTKHPSRLKWPTGIANQIALVVSLAVGALSAGGLLAQALFGFRLHLPQLFLYDLVIQAIMLPLLGLLFLVPGFRRKHGFLLAGLTLSSCGAVVLRLVRFAPPPEQRLLEAIVAALWLAGAATFGLGLLRGQQVLRFFADAYVATMGMIVYLPLKLKGTDVWQVIGWRAPE